MTIDELPAEGGKVLFRSDFPNPNRQSLNGAICTVISHKKLTSQSVAYNDYADHVAVEIRFPYTSEDSRHNGGITWASLDEIHLLPA
mgnify:CR=1 FL=1